MGSVLAAVCVCAYVCWQCGCRTHPNQSDFDERFDRFLQEMEFDRQQFRKWYGRIENDLRAPPRTRKSPSPQEGVI
jgi:hypothetical protein